MIPAIEVLAGSPLPRLRLPMCSGPVDDHGVPRWCRRVATRGSRFCSVHGSTGPLPTKTRKALESMFWDRTAETYLREDHRL